MALLSLLSLPPFTYPPHIRLCFPCLAPSVQTVMIGGLARVDVVDHPGATLYLNVFASDEVGCHLGKTEGADER